MNMKYIRHIMLTPIRFIYRFNLILKQGYIGYENLNKFY